MTTDPVYDMFYQMRRFWVVYDTEIKPKIVVGYFVVIVDDWDVCRIAILNISRIYYTDFESKFNS